MRVGIDYRILAVGRHLVRRGMARYTQQQLRAVLALDSDNEYVLLCGPGTDTGLIDPAVRRAPNVQLRHLPPSTQRAGGGMEVTTLRRAEAFQSWIAGLGLDVYHSSAPFLSAEPPVLSFDACPLVATLYDVIPLLYPSHYLASPADRDAYLFALASVRRAARLIAISDATKNDAATHLGFAPDRIDVAYPIVDERFRPMQRDTARRILAPRPGRARIPERFAMTVSFPHHSKNLETLLRAYARLPSTTRLELPLVVCCLLDPRGARPVWDIADGLGIADDLVLTGLVTDDELAALYSEAIFLVHPSRYEGFGLPVAEAMRCGTPVITTTASSLPEVGGNAALLLDPEDADAMADAMRRLIADPELRTDMSERGLVQSARFDAAQLGRATMRAYQQAAASQAPSTRPRIAVWTPLPPHESGVADTVAELLVELSSACDVEAFVDDGVVPEHDLVGRFPVHHFSAFERRAPFDAVVYEMGASVLHRFVHDGALRHPGTGIAALHDLPWSYVEWATGGDGFRDRLAELEGEEAAAEFNRLAEEAQRRGVELGDSAALDFWARHPMLGPVVEATKAQIVHGPAGAEELTERYPAARPYDVVLGVGDPYEERPGIDVASVRAGAGLPTDVFIAGVFGIVHPSKRIESCIRSLAEVDGDAMLLVVGRVLDPSYEDHLLELARSLAVASRVRFSGPTSFEDFLALQVAVDVILNLRSPLVRQWSGTLMRGLAAGKPVIISDVPYWASMPDDVCSRVTTGGAEVAQLTEQLDKFRVDDDLRRDIGARARSWFEENATVRRMAEGYLDVIEEVTGTVVARDWPTHTDETWARLVKAVQR